MIKNKTRVNIIALALGVLVNVQFAQASVITDVSEFNGFSQLYQLDLPINAYYNGDEPGYNIDNSGDTIVGGIDRVAYYMELQKSGGDRYWLWASMDAFTQDLGMLGVPVGPVIWDQTINNMNVESNVAGIINGTGITTGNMEFWSNCYGTRNDSGIANSGENYDTDDVISTEDCYGSMQIHNYGADQTLFAWNAWNNPDHTDDLGFGNNTGNMHSDWTFMRNSGTYSLKSLEVWVQPSIQEVSEPSIFAFFALGVIGLVSRRFKKQD
jgi:hypothetical protein